MLTVAAYEVDAELYCRTCAPEITEHNGLGIDDLMTGDVCTGCGREL